MNLILRQLEERGLAALPPATGLLFDLRKNHITFASSVSEPNPFILSQRMDGALTPQSRSDLLQGAIPDLTGELPTLQLPPRQPPPPPVLIQGSKGPCWGGRLGFGGF